MQVPRWPLSYLGFRPIYALITVVATLAVIALMLPGCGPSPNGSKNDYKFAIVLHNVGDVAEVATITWGAGQGVENSVAVLMPAHGDVSVKIPGNFPEWFVIETLAWGYLPWAGLIFQPYDYSGCWLFHVVYPTGYYYREMLIK